MRRMIRMLMMTLCLLTALPALAEDVCTVDASTAGQVTTSCSYLRVNCPLPGETGVVLSVEDAWGCLIYQRDYGRTAGDFRSRDIHLPEHDESRNYTVTLQTDSAAYRFTVTKELPLLTDSAVYAGGLSLQELNGGSSRKYAVVLDMHALNQETVAAPLIAGGSQIGEVTFTVLDGRLTVSARLTVEGQIDKANVYVAADALTASTLGTSRFTGAKTRLDRTVDLGNAPYAAVMVQLTVTYDPALAQPYQLGQDAQQAWADMLEDWYLMQMTTANEAVG